MGTLRSDSTPARHHPDQNGSPPDDRFLTPLAKQSRRDLVCVVYLLATGHRLRRGLRVPGRADVEVVRAELRRIEFDLGRPR